MFKDCQNLAIAIKLFKENENMSQLQFGVIGLGRMGGNLAAQALAKGMKVAGYDFHPASADLLGKGLIQVQDYQGFVANLARPRVIFIYIPAGHAVDDCADKLSEILEDGDVIVDGGNSYWGDSIRRHKKYLEKGIHFVDLGTSGGISGAESGACFMLGGTPEESAIIEPILTSLSVSGGYVHAGPPGAGHFVKLVHNGIEYGMLEAIGEGMALLEACPLKLNIQATLDVYTRGSVIRGWLIELMAAAYRQNDGLEKIDSYVDDTGEVNWLVDDAMHMEVPTPVIAMAVMQLINSRDEKKNWAKAISMIRHGFGGHAYGHSQVSEDERYRGRVGQYYFNGLDPNTIVHREE
jgi:6-phosphogluconate dehydrogenase